MNTSDRSVVQIDSALRRRFHLFVLILVVSEFDELKQLLLTSPNATEFWSPDQRMMDEGVLQSLFKLNEFLRKVGPDVARAFLSLRFGNVARIKPLTRRGRNCGVFGGPFETCCFYLFIPT